MKTIRKRYLIPAPIEKVWQALTDARMMDAWQAGPAQFDAREGGSFSLWGGEVFGVNRKMKAPTVLLQDWHGGRLPDRTYPVSFSLKAVSVNQTEVTLVHAEIEDSEFQEFMDGWQDYYFDPIIEFLKDGSP